MCGRYTLTRPGAVVDEAAESLGTESLGTESLGTESLGTVSLEREPGVGGGVDELSELLARPRFNVAPSERMPVVLGRSDEGEAWRAPTVGVASWGLPAVGGRGAPSINARSETAATLATFSGAFARRRCLVPADGFYEWRAKQPYRFVVDGGRGFCFAGLWSESPDERSFCILTTAANETVAPVYDRMPVILRGLGLAQWLDPEATRGDLEGLCRPLPPDEISSYPVSPRVNRAGADEPSMIEPVAPPAENLSLF
ncbi:MAG TPA: SOS response-associated peptidase [Thermoanaerobaculia bacterium]|nr:SOS response-associated peptidase [Thermoanaerobaculia bacterium]